MDREDGRMGRGQEGGGGGASLSYTFIIFVITCIYTYMTTTASNYSVRSPDYSAGRRNGGHRFDDQQAEGDTVAIFDFVAR